MTVYIISADTMITIAYIFMGGFVGMLLMCIGMILHNFFIFHYPQRVMPKIKFFIIRAIILLFFVALILGSAAMAKYYNDNDYIKYRIIL